MGLSILDLTAYEIGNALLTLSDAAYAAAARSRGARLATMDRDLLREGLGLRPSEIVAELDA